MSNNSMVCPAGGEIGRSQASQAAACGLEPHPDMNPILLKPSGEVGSQLVLHGRPWRNVRGSDYDGHFDYLFAEVQESYHRLSAQFEYIVVEGAGGVTELNLKRSDLANLRLARALDAPCVLVADIDRGGVFASVVGTFGLLETEEAERFRSFLVNRFRGDPRLFDDGVGILEERTRKPCLGVFPYAADIHLDAEDGVSLESGHLSEMAPVPGVAVILLPHVSNFTDFRLLGPVPFLSRPSQETFETIFLPGTKAPIQDMRWLRSSGLSDWLIEQHRGGCRIVGVCGGFQMMGDEISDPHRVESSEGMTAGLGLLRACTWIARKKVTRRVAGRTPGGVRFEAYEIHMGQTRVETPAPGFATLDDGSFEGVRSGNAIGTYLHGAFENAAVLAEVLGKPVPSPPDHADRHFDRMAEWFALNVDRETFDREYLS
jgi:adenosylcobyric acid synthase